MINFDSNTEFAHYFKSEYEVPRPMGDREYYDKSNNNDDKSNHMWMLKEPKQAETSLNPETKPTTFTRILKIMRP